MLMAIGLSPGVMTVKSNHSAAAESPPAMVGTGDLELSPGLIGAVKPVKSHHLKLWQLR